MRNESESFHKYLRCIFGRIAFQCRPLNQVVIHDEARAVEAQSVQYLQYLYGTNIKVRLQSGASHVSVVVHLFDSIFTQEHNYQYREPLVKASKPVVLTRD